MLESQVFDAQSGDHQKPHQWSWRGALQDSKVPSASFVTRRLELPASLLEAANLSASPLTSDEVPGGMADVKSCVLA